ncbi:prepilin peptidase [Rubripirellula reticaptiva]|uniref:Type IV leader peptidase family protein n=1 Tax=Rubripirellula reticaptiva TaxID=2528013 RepID=A0A5C6F5M8_9BACT|nr:A24 family peptidase [Rubripirellula reticaptiva]TWU55727.1 Type IV leader peptidase family protein [Rubripirellula reticaptiva]
MELRMMILAFVGLLSGALANHIIYTFAYFDPRPISPWNAVHDQAPPRKPSDRIPFLGWFGLRRESDVHGRGFWVRPLLIELAMAIALPALYWFEAQSGGLLPFEARFPQSVASFEPWASKMFISHAILLTLMVAATFIDFDEKTIPDIITIPGTWIGLIAGAISLNIFLPTAIPVGGAAETLKATTFDSPWFLANGPWMGISGLRAGIAIWSVWCFALADRRWNGLLLKRRGFSRAIQHFTAGLFRDGLWKVLVAMWIAGTIAISVVWNIGGDHWLGLFSSLVGLAAGGGVVWAIRIIASAAMNVEAMGFGDVTLMAMVGAFIGWQGAISAFFLAPFAAIVIVLIQYVITRDPQVPFGPYLCAGTMLTVLNWDRVYNRWLAVNLNMIGPMLLWICIAMLGLMGIMLFVWRHIKMRLFHGE